MSKITGKVRSPDHAAIVLGGRFEAAASVEAFTWETEGFSTLTYDGAGDWTVTLDENYVGSSVVVSMEHNAEVGEVDVSTHSNTIATDGKFEIHTLVSGVQGNVGAGNYINVQILATDSSV